MTTHGRRRRRTASPDSSSNARATSRHRRSAARAQSEHAPASPQAGVTGPGRAGRCGRTRAGLSASPQARPALARSARESGSTVGTSPSVSAIPASSSSPIPSRSRTVSRDTSRPTAPPPLRRSNCQRRRRRRSSAPATASVEAGRSPPQAASSASGAGIAAPGRGPSHAGQRPVEHRPAAGLVELHHHVGAPSRRATSATCCATPSASDCREVADRARVGQRAMPAGQFDLRRQRQRPRHLHLHRWAVPDAGRRPPTPPRARRGRCESRSRARRATVPGRCATRYPVVEVSSGRSTSTARGPADHVGTEPRAGSSTRCGERGQLADDDGGGLAGIRRPARSRRRSRADRDRRGVTAAVRLGAGDGGAAEHDVAGRVRPVQRHRLAAGDAAQRLAQPTSQPAVERVARHGRARPPCARTCTTHSTGPPASTPAVHTARSASIDEHVQRLGRPDASPCRSPARCR